MKKTILIISILTFTYSYVFSQESPLEFKKKQYSFNFEKNRKFLSMGLNFVAYGTPISSGTNVGSRFGYGFFPINHLSLETSFSYTHGFNRPHDDYNEYKIILGTKYFLFPNRRFSLFFGVSPELTLYTYKANPKYLGFIFYNDKADDKIHEHLIPTINFLSGFTIKFWKFVLPISVGYVFDKLIKKEGRSFNVPVYFNISLNYNF